MGSKYKVIFYPNAVKDAEEIFQYIAIKLFNRKAALKLIQKIESAIELISLYPEMGAFTQNEFVQDKTIRKYVVCNLIIFYKVNDDNNEIHIVEILNRLRNYVNIL